MLEVFATSRAVRSFYDTFSHTTALLPKAITIAELEQKAILVPHYSLADEDMRVLLMQEASAFARFKLLHIEREFFTFLKNSTYLFRFFEELSHENVALQTLQQVDTYEHYAEHLEVLQTLLSHYKALLTKHGLYDRITLPEHYQLNDAYLRSLGSVRIHLEGFLSRFEVALLAKIAAIIPLHVTLTLNAYNEKMAGVFDALGLSLEPNYRYEINLSTHTILQALPQSTPQRDIHVYGFSSRIAQLGYMQSAIAQFVEEGLDPEEIVVILPDETFSQSVHCFDGCGNLNFAMGISLKHSHFYQRLSALEQLMRGNEIEDHLRLERLKIEPEIVCTCKEIWHQNVSPKEAMALFKTVLSYDTNEEKMLLFKEAFFAFEHFLTHAPALHFGQVTKLFLNRLLALSQDDVKGGKVTVLGLLETRGVAYKGVIVLDFNDEFVPKRSSKDLFLSSAIRAQAGLPTKMDRENLQRYYYHQLFFKAQKIAIAYVNNETSMPSRFLDELGFDSRMMADEKAVHPFLFEPNKTKIRYNMPFIDAPYALKASPLSATKLKTLLTCKRQFYFRYIAKLKEAKMPSNRVDEQLIGIALHHVLEEAICDETVVDEKILYRKIEHLLKEHNSDEVWGYYVDVWLEKLRPFIHNERARFAEGFRVFKKEFAHSVAYKDFVLEGKIDRIDRKDDGLYVIDYKSGKVPSTSERSLANTTDFQLVFYAHIAGTLGMLKDVSYYALQEGILVSEDFLEEKKELLDATLHEFSQPMNGYALCDEIKHCRLCPYVMLCEREEQI